MIFAYEAANPVKRISGLGLVFLAHIIILYALITGLAQKIVDVVTPPKNVTLVPPTLTPPSPLQKLLDTSPTKLNPPIIDIIPEIKIQPQQTDPTSTDVKTRNDKPYSAGTSAEGEHTSSLGTQAPPMPAFADLNACKPEYPRASLLSGEAGVVTVRFVIGANSQLLEATVLRSSGYRNLDKATVAGLSRCQFKAAMQNGVPVQSSFTREYVWSLE